MVVGFLTAGLHQKCYRFPQYQRRGGAARAATAKLAQGMGIEGGSILRKDYAMAEDQFPINVAILDDYQNVALKLAD